MLDLLVSETAGQVVSDLKLPWETFSGLKIKYVLSIGTKDDQQLYKKTQLVFFSNLTAVAP